MKKPDLSLYVITDPDLSLGRSNAEVVHRAVAGGATAVQYRDKKASGLRMVREGFELVRICREKGIPLIVNDRLDVALVCGADGVHLGQDDIPAPEARRISGPGFIIGVSVRTLSEARRAVEDGADYLAANGVFPTLTKTDFGDPLGLDGVRVLCDAVQIPLVGIGGIDASNAADVIRVGAGGVAVVSFVTSHDNIEERCLALLRSIERGRKG